MSRPYREKSLDAVTTTGPGEGYAGKGHVTLGLFVVANGLNTGGGDAFTVRLEVEGPEGEWSPIYDDSGNILGELTATEAVDVDGDGTTYNAFIRIHGVPAPSVRANLTTYTDGGSGFTVDAYVHAANSGGTGHEYLGP